MEDKKHNQFDPELNYISGLRKNSPLFEFIYLNSPSIKQFYKIRVLHLFKRVERR